MSFAPALAFLPRACFGLATAQAAPQAPAVGSAWTLFVQSIDLFTVVLVAGSVAALAIGVQRALEIRKQAIAPDEELDRLEALTKSAPRRELAAYLRTRQSLPAMVLRRMLQAEESLGTGTDAARSARQAAQLEADAQCARLLRRIEPLATIGNLAPLVGLAGTVWGMILAFTTIGAQGGAAGPAQLSLGISKALFHTLLGLCLAVPALLAYGWLRARVDRLCDLALARTAPLVERVASRIAQQHEAPGADGTQEPQASAGRTPGAQATGSR